MSIRSVYGPRALARSQGAIRTYILQQSKAQRSPIAPANIRFLSSGEDKERQKYDHMRKDMVLNTIQARPDLLVNGGIKRRLSITWKSALIAVSLTSAATMTVFVGVQLFSPNADEDTPRRVFVPLWLDLGLLSKPCLRFPQDTCLLDEKCYQCLVGDAGHHEYLQRLEHEYARYKVLELVSLCQKLRRIIKLPVTVSVPSLSGFTVWTESSTPVVYGLQLLFKNSMVPQIKRQVKQLDYKSTISGALMAAGLKLDRLDTDAEKKIHEQSSGRVHESVLPRDLDSHGNKSYVVLMSGLMHLEDSYNRNGVVHYEAMIDFDHLKINGGVKIISLALSIDGKMYTIK